MQSLLLYLSKYKDFKLGFQQVIKYKCSLLVPPVLLTSRLTLKQTQAIITPLAPKKSHRTLLVGISLIWTVGTLVALPAGIFSHLYQRTRWARLNNLPHLMQKLTYTLLPFITY